MLLGAMLVPLGVEVADTKTELEELDKQNDDLELNWISESMPTYMYIHGYMHRLVHKSVKQIEETKDLLSGTADDREAIDQASADATNGG